MRSGNSIALLGLSNLASWRVYIGILMLVPAAAHAQGTFFSGFEEYPIGSLPTFIQASGTVYPSPVVSDGLLRPSITAPPYEGQHVLRITHSAYIASPDGQPIGELSLHLYMPSNYAIPGANLIFSVGGVPGDRQLVGQWQDFDVKFASPVSRVFVLGFVDEGETLAADFAIDAVRITSVPEPGFASFLMLGAILTISLRRPARR